MMVSFRRTDGHKYSKLGIRRKKKQVYRKSKGTDNKIRLSKRSRPVKVKIGFKGRKSSRGFINENKVVMIYNVEDLKKIKENMIGVIGNIGAKKKKEVAEIIINDKIKIYGFKADKFLKDLDERLKKAKEERSKREGDKKSRDKKAKEKEEKEEKEKKEAEKKEKEKKDKGKLEGKVEEKKEDSSTKKEKRGESESEKSNPQNLVDIKKDEKESEGEDEDDEDTNEEKKVEDKHKDKQNDK